MAKETSTQATTVEAVKTAKEELFNYKSLLSANKSVKEARELSKSSFGSFAKLVWREYKTVVDSQHAIDLGADESRFLFFYASVVTTLANINPQNKTEDKDEASKRYKLGAEIFGTERDGSIKFGFFRGLQITRKEMAKLEKETEIKF